jgi:hypothetical protein
MSAICTDCGVDTAPCTGERGCRHAGRLEYYMVTEKIWALSGMTDGFLCIGCLERRIGRPLCRLDFTGAPINDPGHPWDTPRLAEAKLRDPACVAYLKAHRQPAKAA